MSCGGERWLGGVLCLLTASSVAINILQGRRILALQDKLEDLSMAGELPVGTRVPPLEATDLHARLVRIAYGDVSTPTVLYVFRPSCPWCERNNPSVLRLADAAGKSYRFLGISLSSEDLGEFVAGRGLTFPAYSGVSPAAMRLYHLGTTPEMIVISRSGVVAASWRGAFLGRTRSDIERFFSVRLPDI